MCNTARKGLRIRLRFTDNVLHLACLPWEYLCIPENNRFIALSNRTVITRYIEQLAPHSPLLVSPPLRILVLVSHPSDSVQLQVDHEWRLLQQALADLIERGLVILERLPSATLSTLRRRLRDHNKQIHILHYIGHGYFDEQTDWGGLVLEDEQCYSHQVDADTFATHLQDHKSLSLIFLNACEGARSGGSSFYDGTAQRLVQHEIPAVLAMQFAVSDEAAIVLAKEFYTAIADNYPIDSALAEARKAVYAMRNEWEWGTPVLFSRSKDNQILNLDQGNGSSINKIQSFPLKPEHISVSQFMLDLVHIPAGPFLMGHNPEEGIPDHETPQHEVILPDYWISKYPITNEQYAEFVCQTKKNVARQLGWYGQEPLPAKLNHPVAGVTFHEAREYCQWLSEQTNCICQLPTEAHWEKAARTTDGRIYPWGSEWQENRCNHSSNDLTAVHTFPEQNEYGCCDMVGNIPEWTRSLWGERRRQQDKEFRYPWQNDQRNDVNANNQIRRIWRGGSFADQHYLFRCAARGVALPSQRHTNSALLGFRVIVNLTS